MGSPGAGYGSDVLSGVGEASGLAATGYGLSMNPQLNLINPMTELQPDQTAINQQMLTQQGMTDQYMNQLQGNANQDYQNLTSQLSPSGSLGQQLAGEYNNYGITPQSGAFQEGLGNQYGNMMNQVNAQQAGALNQGYQTQSGLGQTGLQNILGLESQSVNTQNSQALSQFMQQAGLQSALVGGGLNTTGQASTGGATGGTWICTAMREEGILSQDEVNRLHDHLFKVFWNCPFKFIEYFVLGKFVVWFSNYLSIDWNDWRFSFYESVIAEKDSRRAVDLYENSCWMLVKQINHRLRIKTLLFYDKGGY